jgi:hypothetical protein
MVDLIRTAYGIEADAVFGGPSWLDADRFEIIAKAPPESSEADRALMLRALLADRFKLVVHQEDKPLDVYTLTTGERMQLKESEGGAHTFAGGYVDHAAVDMTGLKGAYDFTINWTPKNITAGNGPGARPADPAQPGGASDP